MQQQSHGYDGLQQALLPLIRQLERLDDRMRNDLDALRKEFDVLRRDLVAKEVLAPQIVALEKRIETLEREKLSRQELFALRLAGIAAAIAALIALFDLLIRFRPL